MRPSSSLRSVIGLSEATMPYNTILPLQVMHQYLNAASVIDHLEVPKPNNIENRHAIHQLLQFIRSIIDLD